MRAGTKIEIRGFDLQSNVVWYPAKIGSMPRADREALGTGWYPITYPDGGKLCCHESGFRVVDNRA